LADDMTNIDISGNINRKYAIQIQTSYAPRRKKFSQGFPKDKEENAERLIDAGFTHDKLVMKCRRCEGKLIPASGFPTILTSP
jgi:hypothetical protein